jgi:phenylpropionate dioxygenase-like ring-hydroxylating dioxygenase large terminal subunit
LGLLHRHCIHRGTSLEYGIVAERGIRCCYHGWHFDVDGTVLDTPAEPPTSRIKSNFVQGAYRVHEWQGLLFAYMGPVDAEPAFPTYDCVDNPSDNEVVPFRMNLPCNWVQIVENGSDPIHNAYLHAIVATMCLCAPATSSCPTWASFPMEPTALTQRAWVCAPS